MKRYLILGAITLALVTQGVAQGRGNRGGGSGTGASMGASQRTTSGSGDQLRTQQQDRIHQQDPQSIHATTQQRDQYRDCLQSSSQLHKQLRQMKQLASGNQINAQNREQLRQQLRTQTQAMQQEHERLMNSLNDEQKAAVRNKIQNANAQRKQLADLSDALDFELQQEELSRDRISTQAQTMDRSLDKLQQHYRAINNELQLN